MDAAVGDDREARALAEEAVVADVRRPPRDLAVFGLEQERRNHELVLGEVVDRAHVDLRMALLDEGWEDREAQHRRGDDHADQRAEPQRRGLEELRARVADDLALTGIGTRGAGAGRLPRSWRRLGRSCRFLAAERLRRIPDPEEPEDRGYHGADDEDDLADDQSEEDAGDANGEADRPDGRGRLVGSALTLVRIHVVARIQSGLGPSVNDVAIDATSTRQVIVRAAVRRSLFRLRRKTSTT
jgi:hypothetical protein